MAHPSATDLAHVELIWGVTREQWRHAAREGLQILPRCRSLKRLDTLALGKGTFTWAVQERMRQANSESGSPGSSDGGQGSLDDDNDDAISATRQLTLPPLEKVVMSGYNSSTDEGNDLALAFSQTLRHLCIGVPDGSGNITTISFGRGWVNLPLLTDLVLEGHDSRIVIDPALLTHCPSLVRVNISDAATEYRLQDIDPCLPAHLPHLQCMRLVGWSAVTFHPETLDSMTAIRSLDLCPSYSFIPPMEEVKRSYGLEEDDGTETQATPTPGLPRPRWSWDWHLPLLCHLRLTGEFAMMFQFRMLLLCPSLQALYLDIQTADREHSHDLSQADFFLPPVLSATTDVSTTPSTVSQGALTKNHRGRSIPTHIVVQSLSTLVLRGRWVVDDVLLPHLLTGVFPKVKYVSMEDSEGLTLPSFTQIIRANLKLVKHFDTIRIGLSEPTAAEGAELGLYLRQEFKKDMKIAFHYTLYFQSKEYLLLRDPSILAPPKSRKKRK